MYEKLPHSQNKNIIKLNKERKIVLDVSFSVLFKLLKAFNVN